MAVGGAEQVIRQLVTGVDPERFDARIVCIDAPIGAIGKELDAAGVAVRSLSRSPGFDRKLVAALRGLIRRESIDVLHCHQYTPYCYGVLAAAFTGARVVFTEHGRFHPDRHSWKRRLVNQVLHRLTDETVAISAATRDALVEHEWLPRRSIRVIYNGVAPPRRQPASRPVRERLGIPDRALVIGTLARLDPIKNQRMMIEALVAVRERWPDCVLLLVGDGPEREALERRARELVPDGTVRFVGFVTDIADHLDAIDIFLLTSWSEGTSMTLLEAMSFAKAIVATRVGGNVELLEDGHSALLVDAGDTVSLAACVERLAGDVVLRERLGSIARERHAERFAPAPMIEAYEALYLDDQQEQDSAIRR